MRDFRLWDSKRSRWVKSEFAKRVKLAFGNDDRYHMHMYIRLDDGDSTPIYEGDIVTSQENGIVGVIGYAQQTASYNIFNEKDLVYWPLSESACKECKVVGNIFEDDVPYLEEVEDASA